MASLQAPAAIRLFSKFWKHQILDRLISDITVNMTHQDQYISEQT